LRQINAFWNKVIQRYDLYLEQFAENERQDYYVFQTEFRENPEVMIVGINLVQEIKMVVCSGYIDGTHQWFVTLRRILVIQK
jgi:hypothetical protein